MKPKKIIWDSLPDYEDWKSDLECEYPDASEEERYDIMMEMNDMYLDDERANLDVRLSRPIIVIGDLGMWNGRVVGYKEIKSCNIKDCLYSDCEINSWYIDKNNDLCCDASHHDGTNHYLYRVYKDDVSDEAIERLKNKIYNGTVKRRDITRITKNLGDTINQVYGWQ